MNQAAKTILKIAIIFSVFISNPYFQTTTLANEDFLHEKLDLFLEPGIGLPYEIYGRNVRVYANHRYTNIQTLIDKLFITIFQTPIGIALCYNVLPPEPPIYREFLGVVSSSSEIINNCRFPVTTFHPWVTHERLSQTSKRYFHFSDHVYLFIITPHKTSPISSWTSRTFNLTEIPLDLSDKKHLNRLYLLQILAHELAIIFDQKNNLLDGLQKPLVPVKLQAEFDTFAEEELPIELKIVNALARQVIPSFDEKQSFRDFPRDYLMMGWKELPINLDIAQWDIQDLNHNDVINTLGSLMTSYNNLIAN